MGVSGSIFRLLADTLVEAGVPTSLIEQRTSLAQPSWEDDWVDDDVEERLWELAVERLPDIGVRAARRLPRGTFRGLEYAFRSAPDVEHALRVLVRFQVLLHGRPILALGDRGQISYRSPHPRADVEAAANELAIAVLVRVVREIAQYDDGVSEISFSHPRPSHADELESALAVRAKWSQSETSVLFTEVMLAARSREADPVLHALMHEVMGEELELVPAPSWKARLREKLAEALVQGDASLTTIAKQLGTSERVLQDRLKSEATSFRDELDATRHVLAMRYLSRTDMTISGIALVLGYAEQSTFQRAFKRWSGETPARYRRAHRQSG